MAVPVERQVTLQLWPPSITTRHLVVGRMEQDLADNTVYGQRFDHSEAAKLANRIEEEAFVAAEKLEDDSRGDTGKVLAYARQASQLMLDALKSKRPEDTVFDISGKQRAFLSKEEAEILFKPLRVVGNSYVKICLSNWSFGKDAALIAGEALAALRGNIEDVNLADIVAGRTEAEALEVMAILSKALAGNKLKSLNLSDNALGEKGVRAFSALLKSQSSLESLYFMNNGISEDAAQAICELLPSVENLRTLHFHNNMSGDGGAEALSALLARAPRLEDFQFSSTRVASDGGVALAKGLQAGTSLKRIDLRDNMFGPEAGVALASTLRLHPNLTEAYLSDLGLEDEGAVVLSKALEDGAPNLRVLELGGNEITSKGASSIASCIESKESLTRLSVAENELKDKGAVTICKALRGLEGLLELDFSSNGIGDEGALAVAKALDEVSGFVCILDGNHISLEGTLAVKERFKEQGVVFSFENQEDEDSEEEDGEEDDDETVGAMNSLKV